MKSSIACRDCTEVYDPQLPRCPNCTLPTVVTRQWYDQGNKPPAIRRRAWYWGIGLALLIWGTVGLMIYSTL